MTGQTLILETPRARADAKRVIDAAPFGSVVSIKPPARTIDQNDLMWGLLSDISRAKPLGRRHTPDMWKALFMKACGHHVQFLEGLDGEPFPVGFRSSKLTKRQMSELVEFIFSYGDEHGVTFTCDPRETLVGAA